MHLYFLTRGVKQQMDLFEMFMQTQMFVWKRKNLKTKKDELIQVQGALRPIQLWEYVFPEECRDEVFSMLDINEESMKGRDWAGISKFKRNLLRKMIGKGIKPIPKYKKIPSLRYVEHKGISIYALGFKPDVRKSMPDWGYEQEML